MPTKKELKAENERLEKAVDINLNDAIKWHQKYELLRKAIEASFILGGIDEYIPIIGCKAPCARDLEKAFWKLKETLEEGKKEASR